MQLHTNCDASAPPLDCQCIASRTVLCVSGPMQRVTSTSTKYDETVAGLIKVLEVVDGLQLNVQRYITHVDNCNLNG